MLPKYFVCVLLLSVIAVDCLEVGTPRVTKPITEKRGTDPCVDNGLPIQLHGGNIMPNTNLYLIWYGNWAGNSGLNIIPTFLNDFGTSDWFAANFGYYGQDGSYVSSITLKNTYSDNYSQGNNLTINQAANVVSSAIQGGSLPDDPTAGLYVILASSDVGADGFCTIYCGYHSYYGSGNNYYKFALINNADSQCPNLCTAQTTSPNNNFGVDGMV